MLLALLLSACSSTPKTEEAQYKKMTNSFSYVAFETLSEKTITPSLELYNEKFKKSDSSEIHPEIVHSLAAVTLALSNQPKFAAAEANLAVDAAEDDASRYVAFSAMSIALHSNGWEKLGSQYAAKASTFENEKALDEKYKESRYTAKAILGISAINQGDGPAAELLFAELAEKTGNEWLPVAAHGAAVIVDGPGLSTAAKIKALASRDTVSNSEKQKLAQLEAIAEKYKENPKKMKRETKALVKQWSLDSLKTLGEVTKEAVTEATLASVEAIFLILANK